eukprot:TRINITY_DN28476_c0_g1_i1.p1 TRINITY_DN28476_c0_g1~~TRINITY_DN28476_c0_g1_i1.p1  ORF type:complete len:719 (-),score=95.07 TRINITY_DN28476_c0_g1_i1:97-2253(-)
MASSSEPAVDPPKAGPDATARHEGRIMSFNLTSNWGFIQSVGLYELGLTSSPDKGIFFHGNDIVLGGRTPCKGDLVSFNVIINASAKPQAVEVILASDGNGKELGALADAERAMRYTGTVASWSDKDGWGFINCADLKSDISADIFVHSNDFPNAGIVEKGLTKVTFLLDLHSKPGKPQARRVLHVNPKAALVGPKEKGLRLPEVVQAAAAALQEAGPRRPGTDAVTALRLPQIVLDPRSVAGQGKANKALRQAPYGGVDLRGFRPSSTATATQSFPPRPYQATGSQAPPRVPGGLPPSDGRDRFEGTILNWNVPKAWGFVVAPELAQYLPGGTGIFAHVRDFVGVPEGITMTAGLAVSFSYTTDPIGKPHANNVVLSDPQAALLASLTSRQKALEAGSEAAESSPSGKSSRARMPGADEACNGRRFSGSVKSFNEIKAWGFVQAPELVPVLGEGVGVFFHIKDFIKQDQLPSAGLPVAFTYTVDGDGKPHATQVIAEGTSSLPSAGSNILTKMSTSGVAPGEWGTSGDGVGIATGATGGCRLDEMLRRLDTGDGRVGEGGGHPMEKREVQMDWGGASNGMEWYGMSKQTGEIAQRFDASGSAKEMGGRLDGVQGGFDRTGYHVDGWGGGLDASAGNVHGFGQWTYEQQQWFNANWKGGFDYSGGRSDNIGGQAETMRFDPTGMMQTGGDLYGAKRAMNEGHGFATEDEAHLKRMRMA